MKQYYFEYKYEQSQAIQTIKIPAYNHKEAMEIFIRKHMRAQIDFLKLLSVKDYDKKDETLLLNELMHLHSEELMSIIKVARDLLTEGEKDHE